MNDKLRYKISPKAFETVKESKIEIETKIVEIYENYIVGKSMDGDCVKS